MQFSFHLEFRKLGISLSSNRPKVITRNFAFSNFTNVHFLVQNLFIKVTRVICLVGVIAQTRETECFMGRSKHREES